MGSEIEVISTVEELSIKNNHGLLDSAIQAQDDRGAINSWLKDYRYNSHTYQSYQREITKFLYWLQAVKLTLIELKKEDLINYLEWLKQPPVELTQRKGEKLVVGSLAKPFKQATSFIGLRYNWRIVNALFNYLVAANYLSKNPLKLVRQVFKQQTMPERKFKIRARILEDQEFQAVVMVLKELPEANLKEKRYKAQTKLMFAMLYHLGLRVSELAQARWQNFKIVQERCWYFLIGKGAKPGQIPVNDELLSLMRQYRSYLGLPVKLEEFNESYIFPSSKTGEHLSPRRIREIVKEIFNLAADKFVEPEIQAKLRAAFPHDLRHLLASDLDRFGLSIIDTKEILRHSSEKTTEIYRNSKEAKRHAAIQVNTVGFGELLMDGRQNYPCLIVELNAKPQDLFKVEYFLQALLQVYLKAYKLVKTYNSEELVQQFKTQAKNYQPLILEFQLQENLISENMTGLEVAIKQAAIARGLQVELSFKQ